MHTVCTRGRRIRGGNIHHGAVIGLSLHLPASKRLPGDLPDQFGQVHAECGGQGVNHDDGRVADATFQMIDHGTADAGELRQLALGNTRFLAYFFERSNECAGELL
jgi:hypothetical protein